MSPRGVLALGGLAPSSLLAPHTFDRLFARVADGDRTAVEPAFEALWPIVRRYCLKLLASEPDADDATQASLIKMFEQASQYDRRRPAVGWALAFAYWECRTLRTARLRHVARHQPLDDATPEGVDASPESQAAEHESEQLAQELIADLDEESRALLEGRENELGATLTRLSPATRRKRKQRIIERLKRAFQDAVMPEVSK